MHSTRWWDVAVVAAAAVVCGILLADPRPHLAVGLGAVAALLLVWFTLGRRGADHRPSAVAAVALLAVLSGVLVAVSPATAIVQCIVYPVAWVLLEDTRRAIVANAGIALLVFAGFVVALGGDGLATGALTAVLSFTFSVAIGLWITSVYRLSEERAALLVSLGEAQQQLSAAGRQAGIGAERERLAREIHDTIAQDLTGLVLVTQRARGELGDAPQLAAIEEGLRDALAETRALVAAAAPVALGDGGLLPALTRLAERMTRDTGIRVTVSPADPLKLDRAGEVVLLRSAQEALANVRKHSGASAAQVGVDGDDTEIVLTVDDDGRGFDPEAPSSGYGLDGLRERLALVGGRVEVASQPGMTRLRVILPAEVVA